MIEEPNPREGLQPTINLVIPIKDNCDQCKPLIKKINKYRHSPPYKYGNKMIITLHQDWFGGDVWHVAGVEAGNYQKDRGDDQKYYKWITW